MTRGFEVWYIISKSPFTILMSITPVPSPSAIQRSMNDLEGVSMRSCVPLLAVDFQNWIKLLETCFLISFCNYNATRHVLKWTRLKEWPQIISWNTAFWRMRSLRGILNALPAHRYPSPASPWHHPATHPTPLCTNGTPIVAPLWPITTATTIDAKESSKAVSFYRPPISWLAIGHARTTTNQISAWREHRWLALSKANHSSPTHGEHKPIKIWWLQNSLRM